MGAPSHVEKIRTGQTMDFTEEERTLKRMTEDLPRCIGGGKEGRSAR